MMTVATLNRPAVNDETGHCTSCGRDNSCHEGEPCSDDCPMYLEDLFLSHARELCAAFAEMDGNWKPAENYRAGLMDDSPKVQQALRAFRAATEQIAA